MPERDPTADRLADQLERSFRGGAWHGPAVRETLTGVDAADAAARPIPDGHTIAELTGHLAAWMNVAARRIGGEQVWDLPPEEDFPPDGAADPESWRRTLETLDAAYRRLHEIVRDLSREGLDAPVAGSDPTVRGLVLGVLQHNAYHGGQITAVARALRGDPSRR